MTDSGGPPRRPLCFLSTLLSQKVPEKSDTVLRCIISGQPKPEVTWYKNGQTIEEGSIASSYEFFENQYVHVLHLYGCTQNDTAVYQISAKNCFGMICCSASIEVECSSENTQLAPNLKEDGATGWNRDTQTSEQKSTNQVDEKEPPSKEEESLSLGTPMSADSSSSKFNPLPSLQLLVSNDRSSSSSENSLDAKGTRQTEEACDLNSTEEIADGLLFPNSSHIPYKQDVCCPGTVLSELSKLTDGALNNDEALKLTDGKLNNDENLHSSHQNPKAQQYISVSLPPSEAATPVYPGDRAPVNEQIGSEVSSDDSDSDYELCPEITLTCTEEFSDDDLEYLECSDVMTDYSNAVWQRNLEGTEHVFLLESDDEEMEFRKYGLGEHEPLLSEMGCGPRVSDDTGPMEAGAGFSGDHSQSQEARVRRRRASTHSPPCPQTGMTLTLGSHQDGTSAVTDQGRYKRPAASAENDYPGIQGETRDSHPAGGEFASDSPLTVEEAGTEREVQCLSGELETSGMSQCLEMVAEERAGDTDSWSKRSSEKPGRVRRPGMKGKPKRLKPTPKDSATDDTLGGFHPAEPARHPLTQGERKESSPAAAEAPDRNSQFCPEGAVLTQAEQEAEMLPTPPGALPQQGGLDWEGEGVQVNSLLETSRAPDQSDHPQVQIQEAAGKRLSPSRTPAFSEPAWEESASTGTTADSVLNSRSTDDENASLIQYLERESCTQSPQHEENQDREDNTPGCSWGDPGHGPSLPEANHGTLLPCELSVCLSPEGGGDPRETEALSVASPAPANTVPTLETVCHGPRGRETECLMECLEAGDQGTHGTMDSPVGAPVHNYLPQEICSMDLELAEGQSEESDLCFPDAKTLDVVFQTRGSEPPQSAGQSSKDRNSGALPPPSNALTWDISQKASEGATGEWLATVENSPSTLASTGQGRPSPSISGGLEERTSLSSENSSVWGEEGVDTPRTQALDPTATPTSHSSIVKFPQEEPATLTANLECPQGARESGDTPTGTIATKAHPAEYLPVSIAENSRTDSPEESSPQTPDENIFQHLSNVQPSHILNGSTPESAEELCTAPGGPGVCVCAPPLPEGGFCYNSPLQINRQAGDGSQTMDRVDNRGLEEKFQEEGSETTQGLQQESLPHQAPLSEENARDSWPPPPAVQGETVPAPLDHPAASSREERRPSSGLGTSVSMVTEATVDDDSQTVSSVSPLPNILLEGPTGPGHGEAGIKPTTMTLEASASEVWPPARPAGSECKESAAGAETPDEAWAVADTLQAGAAWPEPGPAEPAASRGGPQAESGSALADNRETHEGQKPARRNYWSCLSARYLSQRRLLESSVDPVDEEELRVMESPPKSSTMGGQETVSNVSQNQQEKQLGVALPAFFKPFLTCPKILESSVDPIDEMGVVEWARGEAPEPSESAKGLIREESEPQDGNSDQRAEVKPAISPVPGPQPGGETIPRKNSTNQNQEASERGEAEQSQRDKATAGVRPATLLVLHPGEGGERAASGCSGNQEQEGCEGSPGKAEQSKNRGADFVFPSLLLSSGLAAMTQSPVGVATHDATGQVHDLPTNHLVEPRNCQQAFSASEERGELESERGKHSPSPSGLTQLPCTSSPEGNSTNFPISHKIEEPEKEMPQSGETKTASAPSSPAVTLVFTSGERASEAAPKTPQDSGRLGPTRGPGRKTGEERSRPTAAQMGRSPAAASEEGKKRQEPAGSGHLAEGMKKKILSKVAALRLRLEERENARKNSSFPKKIPKLETSVSCTNEQKDPKQPPCKREGKAPVLLKKIQAEMFPEHSGNVRLSCQFAEIHEDSTIWWTKDSKPIAQMQRSAGDHSVVSLAVVQASQKDQGRYDCCVKNSYGKVTTEFNLTPEVLKQLSSHQDIKGCEEIEFSQLIFKEDFLRDRYFGDRLRGQIATEELHFGEGVHRKAFRSKVMQGLLPVFQPGHACVLKVHNAVAYGTRNNDELIQRNYKLAAQECYVQNTARYYAKIYAAEAQPLEGFGEVPEIIPIFLIHRPENNIPYATVEEELMGEFVKYSIRDGKEINFLRRDSEAGQKCCTFQHWVYQKTGGCLLVTDMQGVGMKLTDVGIATLAKGYKGFKGNCSMTFIDQFKALHQCNKYCKMLGLKSLQNNNQKQKKPSVMKNKSQPNSTTGKKTASGIPGEKKT
ncbi:alpha-protein kinase 2 [Pteronotus mesoamericanus]|uniref:alpha-protein kinase 2 n=1 Tax=Pteronotus mesoamericanus TaxID=1884717 RepID=UPI0023EB8BBB|nr:alpha-protein kinase 2 [Pteronotus parnellii mesoamericanus]